MKNILKDDFFRSIVIGGFFSLCIYFSVSDDWQSIQKATAGIIGVIIFGISYITSVIREETKTLKENLFKIQDK